MRLPVGFCTNATTACAAMMSARDGSNGVRPLRGQGGHCHTPGWCRTLDNQAPAFGQLPQFNVSYWEDERN